MAALILIVLGFVFAALILRGLDSTRHKGGRGERRVHRHMQRLPLHIYHQLHDVTLMTHDGSTQIDHILISPFGIFVIETKHMKGWIFGNENQAQWTQCLFKEKFRFQNPLRQNYKHIEAIRAHLDVPREALHSVIVFSGDCEFKNTMPANVMRAWDLAPYVLSFTEKVLNERQVQIALAKLEMRRLEPSPETHKQHVQALKKRLAPEARMKCPSCGSNMVLRVAKRGPNAGGKFWGCEAYPKCKGIRSV